jgi:hypothetical protein
VEKIWEAGKSNSLQLGDSDLIPGRRRDFFAFTHTHTHTHTHTNKQLTTEKLKNGDLKNTFRNNTETTK